MQYNLTATGDLVKSASIVRISRGATSDAPSTKTVTHNAEIIVDNYLKYLNHNINLGVENLHPALLEGHKDLLKPVTLRSVLLLIAKHPELKGLFDGSLEDLLEDLLVKAQSSPPSVESEYSHIEVSHFVDYDAYRGVFNFDETLSVLVAYKEKKNSVSNYTTIYKSIKDCLDLPIIFNQTSHVDVWNYSQGWKETYVGFEDLKLGELLFSIVSAIIDEPEETFNKDSTLVVEEVLPNNFKHYENAVDFDDKVDMPLFFSLMRALPGVLKLSKVLELVYGESCTPKDEVVNFNIHEFNMYLMAYNEDKMREYAKVDPKILKARNEGSTPLSFAIGDTRMFGEDLICVLKKINPNINLSELANAF